MSTKHIIATAAVAGLLSGAYASQTGNTGTPSKGSSLQTFATEKHACAGKNSCKGKGGCKTGDNGCKGKNSCKGKGGCATDGSKKS